MIDLNDLRENPDRYRTAAKQKRIDVNIDRLLELESARRELDAKRQQLTAAKAMLAESSSGDGVAGDARDAAIDALIVSDCCMAISTHPTREPGHRYRAAQEFPPFGGRRPQSDGL